MPRGAVLTLDQTWSLARLWYEDRLDPEWRRKKNKRESEDHHGVPPLQ